MDFLKQIDSYDIDILISDLELLENGYVINYIIDPYDVFKFTFPYGIRFDWNINRSLDEIGDDMIAYSYIFDNYKPVILDEYKFELFMGRNNVYTNFSEHINNNLSSELIERFEEFSDEKRKEVYKELSKSASFLLSSALLTESFIKHFDTIFHRKLQIDTFNLKNRNIIDENLILRAFKENQRSPWSEAAFKEWVKIKEEKKVFKNKSQQHVLRVFRATYWDYVVLDRICSINKHIQEDINLNGRYLFLYFSSADKSKEILSQESVKKHLPTINGIKNYDILRSAKHSFLLFLLWDETRKNTIDDLKRLKEIAEKKQEADSIKEKQNIDLKEKIKETDPALLERLVANFERIRATKRADFEETSIRVQIDKHSDFQVSLREKVAELKEKENDPFQFSKLYEDLLEKAKIAREIIPLPDLELSYSIQAKLSSLIDVWLTQNEISLHKGLDSIKGSYQHLPILLFLDQKISDDKSDDNKLNDLLNKVVDYVVKSPKIRDESISDFFEAIRKLYIEAEEFKKADQNYAGILVKGLIYLILPYKKDKHELQEKEAYIFIYDAFSMLKAISEYREYLLDLWKCDYLYFLIWATRRNNLIDESLTLAEKAINDDSTDPRFYHGKCLALYNKYYSPTYFTAGNLNNLESLVESAEEAIKLYKERIDNKQYKLGYEKFIQGSIMALQNTILYCLSLSYLDIAERKIENYLLTSPTLLKYELTSLRNNLLRPIKDFIKESHQDAQDFSELAQTEAVFELCEAIYSSKNSVAKYKIANSLLAINRAIEIEPNSELYNKTKEKIEEWKNIVDKQKFSKLFSKIRLKKS